MEMEIRVLGGLPLTVAVEIEPKDPSVGIFADSVNVDILYIGSRKVRIGERSNWLRKRIEAHHGTDLESLVMARM